MRIAVFSTRDYDRTFLQRANEEHDHDIEYFDARLTEHTAGVAEGFDAVCVFVNDEVTRPVIEALATQGVQLIALRSAGFNHVDLQAAADCDIDVARVPAYSPKAVAEHTLALILGLNRKTHRAYNRVREGNFSLEGLLGFDIGERTVGIVGTGNIGTAFARLISGFGARMVAFDPDPNDECQKLGVEYIGLDELFDRSDIISLHCPLNEQTHHLIDRQALDKMNDGVMLINTGRGALIDTRAVIDGLKSERIGYLGLDVYEEEEKLFFEDYSTRIIRDDVFARLLTFPNVLITGHQGFFTEEALAAIAETTLQNATAFETGEGTVHRVPMP